MRAALIVSVMALLLTSYKAFIASAPNGSFTCAIGDDGTPHLVVSNINFDTVSTVRMNLSSSICE